LGQPGSEQLERPEQVVDVRRPSQSTVAGRVESAWD
jgi:hypothetical protein